MTKRFVLPKALKVSLTIILIAMTAFTFVNDTQASTNGIFFKKFNQNNKTASETLTLIDNYQKDYFGIIKRNDVLLKYEDEKHLNDDKKELNTLFKKVEKQISNKTYLKKYKNIDKNYSKFNGMTDTEMSEFAQRYYDEVNNLLNEVYETVKTKLSPEDFEKLNQSESKWIKDIEIYGNTFEAMEFGNIGKIIYYDYQTNIKQFRTLLLMLYL